MKNRKDENLNRMYDMDTVDEASIALLRKVKRTGTPGWLRRLRI